ncbi:LOW QUALITY PROTEIN: hypothetical protein HZS_2397 [Henneguya salminicola]|nr:LOW QUALITY PROTEIN: hypothetical protein HZS_2397 [Henneguya salminicola]
MNIILPFNSILFFSLFPLSYLEIFKKIKSLHNVKHKQENNFYSLPFEVNCNEINITTNFSVEIYKNDVLIKQSFGHTSYIMSFLELTDSGIYSCFYQWEKENVEKSFQLNVHELPRFLDNLKEKKIYYSKHLNQRIILFCDFSSFIEQIQVSWFGQGVDSCSGIICHFDVQNIKLNNSYFCQLTHNNVELTPIIIYLIELRTSANILFAHGINYKNSIEDSIQVKCYSKNHNIIAHNKNLYPLIILSNLAINSIYNCYASYIYNIDAHPFFSILQHLTNQFLWKYSIIIHIQKQLNYI